MQLSRDELKESKKGNELADTANELAKDANKIAEKANTIAKWDTGLNTLIAMIEIAGAIYVYNKWGNGGGD